MDEGTGLQTIQHLPLFIDHRSRSSHRVRVLENFAPVYLMGLCAWSCVCLSVCVLCVHQHHVDFFLLLFLSHFDSLVLVFFNVFFISFVKEKTTKFTLQTQQQRWASGMAVFCTEHMIARPFSSHQPRGPRLGRRCTHICTLYVRGQTSFVNESPHKQREMTSPNRRLQVPSASDAPPPAVDHTPVIKTSSSRQTLEFSKRFPLLLIMHSTLNSSLIRKYITDESLLNGE